MTSGGQMIYPENEIDELKAQVDALTKALEAQLIDKHPILVFSGISRAAYDELRKALNRLPIGRLGDTMVIGLPPGAELQALSDAALDRMGLMRKTADVAREGYRVCQTCGTSWHGSMDAIKVCPVCPHIATNVLQES